MSDVDVTTIATRPISNRRIVARALGGILRPYDADGVEPRLVADFANNFYFANNYQVPLSTAFTHARSSSATMVDSTGTLITVGSNVPRIGHHVYNGSAWVNEGYLHESEARTNLLLNSGTLSTQNVTVSADPYTLHFTGTGTITLSGASTDGPLVGTGTGENNRVNLSFTPSAGTLTLTVTGTVTNAQLEQASTPSSYIPTSGSTVTRSADTMTASNLPWPAPNVIGPELVTNGGFDTDSDWIEGGSWEISGGSANKPSTGTAVIYQQNVLTVGKVYQITFDLTKTSGTGVDIRPTYNSSTGAIRVTSEGTNKVTFVSGDGYISFASVSDFIGSIDNISVREIDPLAVSIKMDGRMTGDTYTLIRWHEDANNYIVQEAGASDFDFEQSSVAVVDTVTGGSFTSGILVPYTIASRHGSTFINGAVDGTALTANTTPTSLPDLSASDLSLGYDYMGTIKEFAVWNVDITDAGIEEASS
jgi:hypothetical protein